MERSRAADVFADCVAKRWRYDIVLKPTLLWAILLFPLFFGFIGAMDAILDNPAGFGITDESSSDAIILEGLGIAMILEIAVMSFLIFYVNRVNNNHLARDSIWMGSLIGYVDGHGADSTVLRGILGEKMDGEGSRSRTVSIVICAAILLSLAVYGFYIQKCDPTFLTATLIVNLDIIRIMLLLILVQVLATFSSVFSLASRHDALQVAFSEELRTQCATFGLDIPAMRPSSKPHRHWAVRLTLVVITLGIYMIYVLFNSCTRMNRHLMNQWMYEDDLLERMVEFEGGVGLAIRKTDVEAAPLDVALELLRTV